jgi:hypothetical protein
MRHAGNSCRISSVNAEKTLSLFLRHQIASFFAYKSSGQPFDVEIFALVLHIVTEILDGQTENTDMTDGQPVIDEWKQMCENKDKV